MSHEALANKKFALTRAGKILQSRIVMTRPIRGIDMTSWIILLTGLLLCVNTAVVNAEVVRLKSGNTVEGKVIERTAESLRRSKLKRLAEHCAGLNWLT